MTNTAAPRCPTCGQVMVIPDRALHDSQTCPWLCNGCRRGYWEAELTAPARILYRPQCHDWGAGETAEHIRRNVGDEFLSAQIRGTAVHQDHFQHLTTDQVKLLAARPDLEPTLTKAVSEHLKGRV